MSDQHQVAAESAPAASAPPQGSHLMNKITVLALILAVIIGECLAAFMFLGTGQPAASATEASVSKQEEEKDHEKKKDEKSAEDHGAHKSGGHGGHEKAKHESAAVTVSHGDDKEVDLGEYSIMATDPASSTMLLVDFHIFGTVASSDAADFDALYEENRHRIRNQVITIVRSAEMADLTDPSLGLIRRQILEKTNQLLGKSLVQEIIFSKFSFIEQ